MPARRWATPAALLALAAAAGWLFVRTGAGDAFRAVGLSDPGAATLGAAAAARTLAGICGGMTLGLLVFAAFVASPATPAAVSVDGFRALDSARRWSAGWVLTALAMVPLSAATGSGLSLGRIASGASMLVAVQAAEQPKGWLFTALTAVVVAAGTRIVVGWAALLMLLAVTAVGVVASVVVGNPGEGPAHDLATTAATVQVLAVGCWLGVLWAALRQRAATRRRPTVPEPEQQSVATARRVRIVGAVAFVAVVVSGLVLAATLAPGRDPTGAQYRWLLVARAVLLLAAGVAAAVGTVGTVGGARTGRTAGSAGWWHRNRSAAAASTGGGAGALALSVVLLLCATAAAALMAARPSPSSVDPGATIDELLIGYDLPRPFSLLTLVTMWRFDLVLGTAAIAAAGWYLLAVRRLRTAGRRWSPGRTVSWLAGCAVWLLSTSSGASAYGGALFSVHMAVHMLLSMVAPILLVAGQPIRLAARTLRPDAGPGGPRHWLRWLANTAVLRWLSQPLVAASVYVLALYGLYLTPVLDPFLRYHWGHLAMNLFFLATGYLFYNALLGIDLLPRRPGVLPRLAALLLIMPFHTIFGIVVMSSDRLLASEFYRSLELDWRPSAMDDQRLGGIVAWVGGQLPVLAVVVVICWQWYRSHRELGWLTPGGPGAPAAGSAAADRPVRLRRR